NGGWLQTVRKISVRIGELNRAAPVDDESTGHRQRPRIIAVEVRQGSGREFAQEASAPAPRPRRQGRAGGRRHCPHPSAPGTSGHAFPTSKANGPRSGERSLQGARPRPRSPALQHFAAVPRVPTVLDEFVFWG